ncbi:hypothetical protein NDN08_002824 [Rhodosorus marinus]|uniref:Uncharacterized protein n=1 Tax=Rhodosorus marinus TaxID=101924 RepID=A0AAV8UXK7_9RHOD|nr:hypothetical protein NDN08_002824 [Rhodosorus marinus]
MQSRADARQILAIQKAVRVYEISQFLIQNRYAAVLQMFGEGYWADVRRKLESYSENVDVAYIAPWVGKEVASSQGLEDLIPIFEVSESALIVSNEFDAISEVLKKAKKTLQRSYLVAGKLDRTIVSGAEMFRLATGPNEFESRVEMLSVLLQNQRSAVQLLGGSSQELVRTIQHPGLKLATLIDMHSWKDEQS